MQVGRHEFAQEGDLIIVRWVGSPSAAEIKEMQDRVETAAMEHGSVYMILDMSRAGIPDAEARRVASNWPGHHLLRGLAHFGQSLSIRIIESLILRGIQLLGKPLAPSVFARDESEARAWIATQRTKNPR